MNSRFPIAKLLEEYCNKFVMKPQLPNCLTQNINLNLNYLFERIFIIYCFISINVLTRVTQLPRWILHSGIKTKCGNAHSMPQ